MFAFGVVIEGVFNLASSDFCLESEGAGRLVSIPVPVLDAPAGLIPPGLPALKGAADFGRGGGCIGVFIFEPRTRHGIYRYYHCVCTVNHHITWKYNINRFGNMVSVSHI